jgi:O-antigen/teichoic acid export membrane protein
MLNSLLFSHTSRQTFFLFSAQLFGMVVAFVSGMLVAKGMGAQKYGLYSFATAIISFLSIFFEFGYFASVSRLLAVNQDRQQEKEYVGAAVVILGLISTGFVLLVFVISFCVDSIFEEEVGGLLRIASIVSWGFVIPFFMELVLKGSNHIEYLSGFNLLWKLFYLFALIGLYMINQLTPVNVLLTMPATCIISFALIILKLRPQFAHLKNNVSKIHYENHVYGFHVYKGRVIDVSTYQIDRLLIGYFVNATQVGYYSMANSMANPISSFSIALSSSKFKKFSDGNPISNRILKTNLLWILLAIIGANGLGFLIIHWYLGNEFKDVIPLLILMTMAVGFQAGYQPYNAWLSSNGYGKELKVFAYKMAFISLFLNLLLITNYGANGAAIASAISMLYALIGYKKRYAKFSNELIYKITKKDVE